MTRARTAATRRRASRQAFGRTCRATLALLLALGTLPGLAAEALASPVPLPALPPATPLTLVPPGPMVLDYTGRFTAALPARLNSAGVGIVVRYVGAAKWKSLSRWEANALRRRGIDIAVVYETKANWMLGGRKAGVAAAKKARAATVACGGPRQPFVYFACDVGTRNYSAVNACLRGAASVLGADHVGIYGSYSVCQNALRSGYATKAWQTEAWSGGRWLPQAVLWQKAHRFNGNLHVDYDSNILLAEDIGQWGAIPAQPSTATTVTTPAPAGLRAVTFTDASTGCAVGEQGAVVRTTDGGSTWALVPTPTNATLTSVAFTDATTGFAFAENGAAFGTTDGGATWASVPAPDPRTLETIAVAGTTWDWAVTDGALMHVARPGGGELVGTVRGVVTNALTGAPASNVSVQVGSRPPVPTATDGSFVVARMTPGTYAATVTSPLYITRTKAEVTVTAGGITTIALRSVPRTPTAVSMPSVALPIPASGAVATFSATFSPTAGASANPSTLYLSHYEQKTVWKRVRGKRRKRKVWYWRSWAALPMTPDGTGQLTAVAALPPGQWRAYVRCWGSPTYLPSTSATLRFVSP